MKKVLLIGVNARYTHTNLALYYINDVVEQSGKYTSQIVEFSINTNMCEIIETLLATKADVYAFSLYVWNRVIIDAIINDLQKLHPEAIIVLGGPEAAFIPEKWAASNVVLILGAEGAMKAALLDDFSCSRYRADEPSFADVTFPYKKENLKMFKNHYIYYESSRGCPFSCAFCLSSAAKAVQFRSIVQVKNELSLFIDAKVKIVKFVDRTFNSDRKRAREIWNFLIEQHSFTKFHFEIEASRLEDEDFYILSKVQPDLFQFEIGVQSCHSKTLKAVNRSVNVQLVLKNIKKLVVLGNIHLHTDAIAGLPFEGLSEFANTFDEIFKCGAEHFQLGFLKLLPGTELCRNSEQYGMVASSLPPYQVYKTRWLSVEDFSLLHRLEAIVDVLWNSGKFINYCNFIKSTQLSVFTHLLKVVKYMHDLNFSTALRSSEKISDILLKFHQLNRLEADAVLELLVYDLLKNSKSLNYPAFYSNTDAYQLRSIYLKKLIKQTGEQQGKKAVKRIICFHPAQDLVRKILNLEKDEVVVFVNGDCDNLYEIIGYRIIYRKVNVSTKI